jgi:hypothetical protein
MNDEIMSALEVARLVGVSVESVRRHAERWGGFKLPGARSWRFRRSELLLLCSHDGGQAARR